VRGGGEQARFRSCLSRDAIDLRNDHFARPARGGLSAGSGRVCGRRAGSLTNVAADGRDRVVGLCIES
jgi:hypothetical protein